MGLMRPIRGSEEMSRGDLVAQTIPTEENRQGAFSAAVSLFRLTVAAF